MKRDGERFRERGRRGTGTGKRERARLAGECQAAPHQGRRAGRKEKRDGRRAFMEGADSSGPLSKRQARGPSRFANVWQICMIFAKDWHFSQALAFALPLPRGKRGKTRKSRAPFAVPANFALWGCPFASRARVSALFVAKCFRARVATGSGTGKSWRRERDSNPRCLAAFRFSRPARSTAPPSLRCVPHRRVSPGVFQARRVSRGVSPQAAPPGGGGPPACRPRPTSPPGAPARTASRRAATGPRPRA